MFKYIQGMRNAFRKDGSVNRVYKYVACVSKFMILVVFA